jgi:hypothetical protein
MKKGERRRHGEEAAAADAEMEEEAGRQRG